MNATVLLCATSVLLVSADARSDGGIVPVDDVLSMMARVPGRPGDPRSSGYRWDRKRGAKPVAEAIAASAPSREWAARMAVYAIHESGLELVPCAAGDGGRSLGPWQLQETAREVACDPARAASAWLRRAIRSIEDCAPLPDAERLAELVSGSCSRGRQLARRRETLVLGALEATGVE